MRGNWLRFILGAYTNTGLAHQIVSNAAYVAEQTRIEKPIA